MYSDTYQSVIKIALEMKSSVSRKIRENVAKNQSPQDQVDSINVLSIFFIHWIIFITLSIPQKQKKKCFSTNSFVRKI